MESKSAYSNKLFPICNTTYPLNLKSSLFHEDMQWGKFKNLGALLQLEHEDKGVNNRKSALNKVEYLAGFGRTTLSSFSYF